MSAGLLNHLRQVPKAAANRKRKRVQNLHRTIASVATLHAVPKSVSVSQRVKEYPDDPFAVSANKLFYNACREEGKSVITLYVQSEKHSRGKVWLQSKNEHEQDIVMALQKYN